MTGYYLSQISFENGVMDAEYKYKVQSQREFFEAHGIDLDSTVVLPVDAEEWRFNRVYLTKGSRRKGTGWAFHKTTGGKKDARI